jgi:outer membrane immunogenic protein
MYKFALFSFAVIAFCLSFLLPAGAQSVPVAEAGLSYNYVHTNAPPGDCGCISLNGGSGSIAYNFSRSFSAVADLGAQHASNIAPAGSDLTLTSYLFGPRYSLRNRTRFTPFGQVLLGGAHASGSLAPGNGGLSGGSNAFAMVAGGGLDIGLTHHIAIRAIEADYYMTRFNNGVNDRQNNLRLGAGLVFRFGNR